MVRIQLELPEEQVAALDELMKETKTRTRKDFFNNALTLLEWAVKQKKMGRSIVSLDKSEQNIRELVMPALESVPTVVEEVGTSTSGATVQRGS